MSEHDPFDGQYDEPTPEPVLHHEQEAPARQTYTLGWLRRQDKDDLQAIAAERGLPTSGTRDALISRIAESQ